MQCAVANALRNQIAHLSHFTMIRQLAELVVLRQRRLDSLARVFEFLGDGFCWWPLSFPEQGDAVTHMCTFHGRGFVEFSNCALNNDLIVVRPVGELSSEEFCVAIVH